MTAMEIKKTQIPTATESASYAQTKRTQNFVSEIKAEIQRINWTSKEELQVYTTIVVVATFTFGMALYVVDLIIQLVLHNIASIIQLIGG